MKAEIIAQIFGFGALASSIVIYSRKKRSSLLLFKACQDVLWAIHYVLLDCLSAAATSAICVTRSVVFYNSDKKWAKSKLWLPAYILFYAVSAALTWKNAYSVLPALASCTSTVAFRMKKTERIKALQIVASLITLTYNILQSHSLTVYIGVSLTIGTSVVSLIRGRKSGGEETGSTAENE